MTLWLTENYLIVQILLATCQVYYLLLLYGSLPAYRRRKLLKQRMAAYAELKGALESCSKAELLCPLPPCQHEVLLGTLKKVEAKSATMTTVLVFALSAFVAVAYPPGEFSGYEAIMLLSASMLVLPLFFAFQGMRQLDTMDIQERPGAFLANQLQDALLDDLWKKELGFRFSRNSLLCTTIALLLLLLGLGVSEIIKQA